MVDSLDFVVADFEDKGVMFLNEVVDQHHEVPWSMWQYVRSVQGLLRIAVSGNEAGVVSAISPCFFEYDQCQVAQ